MDPQGSPALPCPLDLDPAKRWRCGDVIDWKSLRAMSTLLAPAVQLDKLSRWLATCACVAGAATVAAFLAGALWPWLFTAFVLASGFTSTAMFTVERAVEWRLAHAGRLWRHTLEARGAKNGRTAILRMIEKAASASFPDEPFGQWNVEPRELAKSSPEGHALLCTPEHPPSSAPIPNLNMVQRTCVCLSFASAKLFRHFTNQTLCSYPSLLDEILPKSFPSTQPS